MRLRKLYDYLFKVNPGQKWNHWERIRNELNLNHLTTQQIDKKWCNIKAEYNDKWRKFLLDGGMPYTDEDLANSDGKQEI